MYIKKNLIFIACIFPQLVFAATTQASELVIFIDSLFSTLVPLIISAAIIYFLWGVLKYVKSGDSEDQRIAGRHMMVNGVIAVFVMVSIWGLVSFLDNTFKLTDNTADSIQVPVVNSNLLDT